MNSISSQVALPLEIDSNLGSPRNAFVLILYYATIFTIPFYRWRTISPAYGFLKIDWLLVLALGLVVIPVLVIQKRLPTSFNSNLWPRFLLFFVVNVISSVMSKYPGPAFDGVVLLVQDGLFIAINLIMIGSSDFRKFLPGVLIGSISANAFLAVLGYFFNVEVFLYGGRGFGGTSDANNAALMGVFILPLISHFFFHAKTGPRKLFALGLFVLNVLGVVSTESRGGFLNMSVILLILAIQNRHRFTPQNLGLLLALFGTISVATVMVIPEKYISRQKTLSQGTEADVSTQRRAAYLLVGLKSFQKNPILGGGTETFQTIWGESSESLYFSLEERLRPAHNTYMEVLVGSGLIGLFLFVLLLWRTMNNYNRAAFLLKHAGNLEMSSLVGAYRLCIVSVLLYFFFKSGIEHKLFLLALPLSQVALDLAKSTVNTDI